MTLETQPEYGVAAVKFLATHFANLESMESFSLTNALNEWRRMKADLPGYSNFSALGFKEYWVHFLRHKRHPQEYPTMCILIKLCLLVVVDSSCCERGYSAMNRIHTDSRNRLKLSTLNDLLFIALNGPPVKDLNTEKIYSIWLSEKSRRKVTATGGQLDADDGADEG